MNIIGIGETTLDTTYQLPGFVQEDQKQAATAISRSVGGPVPAALILLHRLGLGCTLITQLGTETEGAYILQKLTAEHLQVLYRKQGSTKHNVYLVNALTGSRTGVKSPVKHTSLELQNREKLLLQSADALLFDRHEPSAAQQAVELLPSTAITLMDPSTDTSTETLELLLQTTVPIAPIELLKKHLPDATLPQALKHWYEQSEKPIVLTAGGQGCVLFDGTVHHIPSVKITAVDTLGAGDIFRGAVCYGLLLGWQIRRVLEYANLVAALQCSRPGNGTAIPHPAEISSWQQTVQYHSANVSTITNYYQRLDV